jgi:hypothetical protein
MSSTNRGARRITNDEYFTPASAIDPLMATLAIPREIRFLEPCRGGSAIYDRVTTWFKEWAEIAEGVDYLSAPLWGTDLIITNPPFSLALEFLEKSLEEADSVFYLLRLNFLGSKKRKAFWNKHRPTHQLVLSERPCFAWACKGKAKNGKKIKGCGAMYHVGACTVCSECGGNVGPQTDSVEYAWFGWDRAGICQLEKGIHVL